MTLAPNSSFGPYTILAPLGAGGMGSVYRARDAKLGRELAVKVLPEEFAADRDRLARFEQEARTASALNHPNIITIFEVGEAGSTPYIAMEVVEGRSLRDVLDDGKLPLRKTIAIAAQIADALGAAHEKGVVHRDLKPENVMITKSGHVKLLDFGLAKLAAVEQTEETMRMAGQTRPGTVMGTVGYMSPEQASGLPADYRSDQFSLGAILYEMLTGRRAFQKATSVETLTAILREEPEPLAPSDVPPVLRWIIDRLLAKSPDDRYDSTRDLTRDLQRVRDSLSEPTITSGATAVAKPARKRSWLLGLAALVVLAAIAAAAWLGAKRFGKAEPPKFHRLSFRRGFITSARFAPDGQTVVYGAGWENNPVSIFTAREENSESLALPLPPADVLSITKDGRMAVSLGRRYTEWFVSNGKLAETALSGGAAARELMDNVQDADWFPDGRTLAVAHNGNAQTILDFPPGTPRYSASGWISHVRVAPDGQRVAFIDHPVRGDDRGTVTIIDRNGKREALSPEYASIQGLAWRPDGKEIWFTGAEIGFLTGLRAVTLDKKVRTIFVGPSRLIIHDISPVGRVLLASEDIQVGAMVSVAGGPERDVSWLDCSFVCDISADGKHVLLDEQGEGAHAISAVYVRGTDGSPAVRLSDGFGSSFSPDGKSVVVSQYTDPPHLLITPLGTGTTRDLGTANGQFLWPSWFPDGKRVAYTLAVPGKQPRVYAQSLAGGAPTPIAPEGVGGGLTPKPISADGAWLAATGADGKLALWPVGGSGSSRAVPNAVEGESALRWSSDGKSIFTYVAGERPSRLYQLDVATGARKTVREIHPADEAGILVLIPTVATADGQGYGYTYLRITGSLYMVDGLK